MNSWFELIGKSLGVPQTRILFLQKGSTVTTLTFNDRMCRICSEKSSYEEISSTNQFGSADLDLRPPEMMRSTMRFWVQKCPRCEYIYETVDKGTLSRSEFEDLKQNSSWQKKVGFSTDLQLCEKFAKYALILELEDRSPVMIAQQFLRAAWAADDQIRDDVAKAMRCQAALYFEKAIENIDQRDEWNIRNFVLLDILRRSSRFDDCRELIVRLKKEKLDINLTSVLRFQTSLISEHDIRAHELKEIYSLISSE